MLVGSRGVLLYVPDAFLYIVVFLAMKVQKSVLV